VTEPAALAGLPIAYPDAEIELMDLLGLLGVTTTTWLPEGWEPPIIQVQRIGGAPDPVDITDYPLMRVAYYGPNRDASVQMSQDGNRLVLGYRGRALPSGTTMDFSAIEVGGLVEPDLDPDDRRVTVNYTLGFRRQWRLAAT
jgi:hypothetical protein